MKVVKDVLKTQTSMMEHFAKKLTAKSYKRHNLGTLYSKTHNSHQQQR